MWSLLNSPQHLKFRQIFIAAPLMFAKTANYIDRVANSNEDPNESEDNQIKYWMGLNDWIQGLSSNYFSRLIETALSSY